jgi:hypothetical protein
VDQHADVCGGREGNSKLKEEEGKEFRAKPIRHTLLLARSLDQ